LPLATVSIVRTEPPIDAVKVDGIVRRAFALIGGIDRIARKGDSVVIEPNLMASLPPPVTTNIEVVKAIIRMVSKVEPDRIVVGEDTIVQLKLYEKMLSLWTLFHRQ